MAGKLIPTLKRRQSPIASSEAQLQVLDQVGIPAFHDVVREAGHPLLQTLPIEVLQINVGKRCNQTCRHCHVDAGPERSEVMSREVLDACLLLLESSSIPTVDITGGAPELHPEFDRLVTQCRALGKHVIDRCNLTILQLPEYAYLPEFFAQHEVEVTASLPSYAPRATETQRGEGVFAASIAAIRRLNQLGYGGGKQLTLNLVTNPAGAFLPGNQGSLEREWKRELDRRFGITFDRLFTITNMPISRFLDFLIESGNLESYLSRLVQAFNPATLDGLMCRTTLSVGWNGHLYDCDFNQMLDLHLPSTIFDFPLTDASLRPIRTGPHCFGCTAGAGSSCGGATAV